MVQQHGLITEETETLDLPQSEVPLADLEEEKKMAKFSKTAEFRKLKEFMEAKIAFYQGYLPNGTPIPETTEDLTAKWLAANVVIGEFKGLLNSYEMAEEVVKDAAKKK